MHTEGIGSVSEPLIPDGKHEALEAANPGTVIPGLILVL